MFRHILLKGPKACTLTVPETLGFQIPFGKWNFRPYPDKTIFAPWFC
jgi:hypothetical protein